MSYIGKQPAAAALTASDITDGIVSTAKIADTAITNAKLNADIISADTALAVAPAATDEFLVSDAGTLKRIDASLVGRGKVLQVVTGTTEGTGTTTATSFASTGLTASITPSATSSKIFVTCSFTGSKNSDALDGDWAYFSIHRGATDLGGSNGRGIVGHHNYINNASVDNHFPVNMVVLDSPSSTSSLTYTVEYAGADTNDTIAFNNRAMKTSIILMEIAG